MKVATLEKFHSGWHYGLKFWSINDTSIYENSELNIFKNIKFFGEIFSNWSNDLLGTKVYKTLESY